MNEHFAKSIHLINRIKTCQGELKNFDTYYLYKLIRYANSLFAYSKFKVGNIVKLKETPEISETVAWGWFGYKDKLVKGAKGVVDEVDHDGDTFTYNIKFDFSDGVFNFTEDDITKSY